MMELACTAPRNIVNFDIIIARRITNLRETLNFTASNLDRLTEFSLGTIGRLERQDQHIYAFHLIRICQVTGVNLNYFYDEEETCAARLPLSLRQPEPSQLLQIYNSIENPATRRYIFELIETLALEQAANDLA